MRGIHVYSSRPLLAGRNAAGQFSNVGEVWLPECVKLMMELSALQWRRTNGEMALYTDTPMLHYLERRGLTGCWDDIDTDTLDRFFEAHRDIDPTVFWSIAKFACYLREPAPFACIDVDLVVWRGLELESLDFAFAHWEAVEPGDESYPPPSRLNMPSGYVIPARDHYTDRACNMAITYLGDTSFKDEFVSEALSYMSSNHSQARGRYATPEILFVEQRLPLALAMRDGLRLAPVMDITWSPGRFRIVDAHPDVGDWFFSDLDGRKPFTHLWFHKKYLMENDAAHRAYCERIRQVMETGHPGGSTSPDR